MKTSLEPSLRCDAARFASRSRICGVYSGMERSGGIKVSRSDEETEGAGATRGTEYRALTEPGAQVYQSRRNRLVEVGIELPGAFGVEECSV